ncbi:MAG: hypothetical protein KC766_32830, partial [Myxococcales bacterium]|nr:hypothetical protein [Myxococcales bacterium]
YKCTDYGTWTIERYACSNPYDSCPGTEITCYDEWQVWEGTNPPPPCPAEKPAPSSACDNNWGFGPATCGYPCENGKGWTVGTCYYWNDPIWAFDGSCDGDCSQHDADLLEYVQQNKSCTTADDCKIVYTSGCSARTEHCTGAFYVNKATSEQELGKLDQALSSCMSSGCVLCDGIPAPAACNGGLCGPALTD